MATTESAQEVEAGCELDAVMAERVMGWTRVSSDDSRRDDATTFMVYRGEKVLRGTPYQPKDFLGWLHSFAPWSPSAEMSAAWEVVEAMKARQWHMAVEVMSLSQYRARATFGGMWMNGSRRPYRDAVEESAPLAICRAALKAVEQTQDTRA